MQTQISDQIDLLDELMLGWALYEAICAGLEISPHQSKPQLLPMWMMDDMGEKELKSG